MIPPKEPPNTFPNEDDPPEGGGDGEGSEGKGGGGDDLAPLGHRGGENDTEQEPAPPTDEESGDIRESREGVGVESEGGDETQETADSCKDGEEGNGGNEREGLELIKGKIDQDLEIIRSHQLHNPEKTYQSGLFWTLLEEVKRDPSSFVSYQSCWEATGRENGYQHDDLYSVRTNLINTLKQTNPRCRFDWTLETVSAQGYRLRLLRKGMVLTKGYGFAHYEKDIWEKSKRIVIAAVPSDSLPIGISESGGVDTAPLHLNPILKWVMVVGGGIGLGWLLMTLIPKVIENGERRATALASPPALVQIWKGWHTAPHSLVEDKEGNRICAVHGINPKPGEAHTGIGLSCPDGEEWVTTTLGEGSDVSGISATETSTGITITYLDRDRGTIHLIEVTSSPAVAGLALTGGGSLSRWENEVVSTDWSWASPHALVEFTKAVGVEAPSNPPPDRPWTHILTDENKRWIVYQTGDGELRRLYRASAEEPWEMDLITTQAHLTVEHDAVLSDGRLLVTVMMREPVVGCVQSWQEEIPGGELRELSPCYTRAGNIRSGATVVASDAPKGLCLHAMGRVQFDKWTGEGWTGNDQLGMGASWCAAAWDPQSQEPVALFSSHQETVLTWGPRNGAWERMVWLIASESHAVLVADDGTRHILLGTREGLFFGEVPSPD